MGSLSFWTLLSCCYCGDIAAQLKTAKIFQHGAFLSWSYLHYISVCQCRCVFTAPSTELFDTLMSWRLYWMTSRWSALTAVQDLLPLISRLLCLHADDHYFGNHLLQTGVLRLSYLWWCNVVLYKMNAIMALICERQSPQWEGWWWGAVSGSIDDSEKQTCRK